MRARRLGAFCSCEGLQPAAWKSSGQIGIWIADQEPGGSVVIDERIAGQPLDGPALGADIAERVPRWQQVRILIVELALEPAAGGAPVPLVATISGIVPGALLLGSGWWGAHRTAPTTAPATGR